MKIFKSTFFNLFLLIFVLVLTYCLYMQRAQIFALQSQVKVIMDVLNLPSTFGITLTSEIGNPDNTPVMGTEYVTYTGVIKKEEIPEEYALGDYWYIFYFDQPQIIETVNGNMLRENLEIQASAIESLDPYLNKKVIVSGRLSYGYAESRIILVDDIK